MYVYSNIRADVKHLVKQQFNLKEQFEKKTISKTIIE